MTTDKHEARDSAASHDLFCVDFEGFKRQAGEFFRRLKDPATVDQIEAGMKALGVAYIHMEGDEMEIHQAAIVMDIATRKSTEAILSQNMEARDAANDSH